MAVKLVSLGSENYCKIYGEEGRERGLKGEKGKWGMILIVFLFCFILFCFVLFVGFEEH